MAAQLFTPFSFDQHPVRVIDRDGQPWFIATDIAEALDYRNAPDLTRNLDDDEQGTQIVRTLGGDQKLTVINESGLYSAILRSRKPEAKRFKKWVTSEVLPSIRKTGSYHARTKPLPLPGCIVAAEAQLLRRLLNRAVGPKKRQWALDEMCRYLRVNALEQIAAEDIDKALAFVDGLRQDPQLIRPISQIEWAARTRLLHTRFLLSFGPDNTPELRALDLDEFVASPANFADRLREDGLGFLPPDLAEVLSATIWRLGQR